MGQTVKGPFSERRQEEERALRPNPGPGGSTLVVSQQAPHLAWGRQPHTNAETWCRGPVLLPRCRHNEGKQGPGPEPWVGDRPSRQPAPPSSLLCRAEESVATASARAPTVRTHPSALHGATRGSSRGESALGASLTRELHPAWTDRVTRDCRLCPRAGRAGLGLYDPHHCPPARTALTCTWGRAGAGAREATRAHGGPRPLGKACTRTARGAELRPQAGLRPGKPGVAAPTPTAPNPHKPKVTKGQWS